MARQLRIEYPGAVYHVISRGNAKAPIFLSDHDRVIFFRVLSDVIREYNWICHSYCLMGNHYHLLIETIDSNLSLGMRQLNGVYTQRFNRLNDRIGHLFQGRYKSILVQKESYLLELCRYIALNPVRAGIVDDPCEYTWSSYNSILGTEKCPKLLTINWVLQQFSSECFEAKQRYKKFVLAGIGKEAPRGEIKGGAILGNSSFAKEIEPYLKTKILISEIPRKQRQINRPNLKMIFSNIGPLNISERNDEIEKLHARYACKINEIADAAKLHYSTVSNILKEKKTKNRQSKT